MRYKFPKGHKMGLGSKRSKEVKKKISEGMKKWHKEVGMSEEARAKISKAHMGNKWGLGNKMPEEQKRKLSEARKGSKGSNWKGGVTPEHKNARNSLEWKVWRKAVFERDKYFCQMCGMHSKYLRPHHIKFFADYPELRFVVSNGITLCDPCHRLVHRYFRRVKKLQWDK